MLTNPIPTNGVVAVTFSDVVNAGWGGVANRCFYKDFLTETASGTTYTAACAASTAKTVKVTSIPALDKKSSINFRIVSTLAAGGTAKITEVLSSVTDGGLEIDKCTTCGADLTMDSNATKANSFVAALTSEDGTADATNNLAGGNTVSTYTYYLALRWRPSESSDSNSVVTISAPLSTSGLSDYQFYVNTDNDLKAKLKEANVDLTGGTTPMDGTGTNLARPALTESSSASALGTITWALNGQASNFPTSAETQTVGLYRTAGDPMGWPKVSTNASTKYEFILDVVTSTDQGHKPGRAASIVTVAGRPWGSVSSAPFTCQDTGLSGMVQKTIFKPSKTVFNGDSTSVKYYIDIEYAIGGGNTN
jgi:hypothetical protein